MERLVNYDNKHSCFDAAIAGVHFCNVNDIHRLGLLNQQGDSLCEGAEQEESQILLVFNNQRNCNSAMFHAVI